MKHKDRSSTIRQFVCLLMATALVMTPLYQTAACTRLVHETGYQSFITGRTMDWMDPAAQTALWVFPRGMKRVSVAKLLDDLLRGMSFSLLYGKSFRQYWLTNFHNSWIIFWGACQVLSDRKSVKP